MGSLHPTLVRQLRRSLGVDSPDAVKAVLADGSRQQQLLAAMPRLLEMVSEHYRQGDRDLHLRTRSLEISSQELSDANDRLRDEALSQKRVLDTLRESTREFLPEQQWRAETDSEADLLEVATLLRQLVQQHRQDEKALADSERQFRGLVANLPGCVYRRGVDRQATAAYVSDGILDLCGYPASDFVSGGRQLADLVLPEDLPRVMRRIHRATRRASSYEIEYRIRHADGSVRWAFDRGQGVFDADGRLLHFDGLVLDRTATRLAEMEIARARSQFQSAIEALGVGFIMFDEHDRMLVCNTKYREIMALPCLQGRPTITELMRERYRADAAAVPQERSEDEFIDDYLVLWRSLDDGARVREGTIGDRWYRLDESRTPEGLTVVLRTDITESKRLAREMSAARIAAEAASRAKTRFLANMSHELRTPLNAVIGAAQLLQTDGDDVAARSYLVDAIHRSGTNLLGLIENILDLTRIEAGELPILAEEFPLLECVESALVTTALAARAKGLTLSSDIDPAVSSWCRGDPLRVRQVLLNLLGNAVKFTEKGEILLQVRAGDVPDRVRISVRDTGIGMDAATLQYVFEPFRQADDGASRRFGGSGLGLAIVRQVVEAMGGKVSVWSEPGKGSRFDLDLVLPPVAQQRVSGAVEAAPAGAKRTGRARLLVVEDDPLNQTIVRRLLTHAGYDSEAANNGTEALDLLNREHFDLVLMDCQMPDMDGLEVTRRVRAGAAGAAGREVPIVALTANAFAEDRTACLAAGMNDFLTKPVLADRLMAAVERWTRDRVAIPPAGDGGAVAAGAVAAVYDPRVLAALPMVADGSEPGYADELLQMFLQSGAQVLGDIERDTQSGNAGHLQRAVHTLKSCSASVGALELAALSAAHETRLRQGQAPDPGLPGLLAAAFRRFEHVVRPARTERSEEEMPS